MRKNFYVADCRISATEEPALCTDILMAFFILALDSGGFTEMKKREEKSICPDAIFIFGGKSPKTTLNQMCVW